MKSPNNEQSISTQMYVLQKGIVMVVNPDNTKQMLLMVNAVILNFDVESFEDEDKDKDDAI